MRLWLFSLAWLVRMNGLIPRNLPVTFVTKTIRLYKALTLHPLCLNGNGTLELKTSISFSSGFFFMIG
jgi:hypothetical protein